MGVDKIELESINGGSYSDVPVINSHRNPDLVLTVKSTDFDLIWIFMRHTL